MFVHVLFFHTHDTVSKLAKNKRNKKTTHHVLFHHSQKDTKVNFSTDWKHFLDFIFLSWKSKDSQADLQYKHTHPITMFLPTELSVDGRQVLFAIFKQWTDQYPSDVDGPDAMRVKKIESWLHVPHLLLSQLHSGSFSALLQYRAARGSSSARTRSLEDKMSVQRLISSSL